MFENRNPEKRKSSLLRDLRALILVGGEADGSAIQNMLQSWDVTSEIAPSCEQALARIDQTAAPFNLVFIDPQRCPSNIMGALLTRHRIPAIMVRSPGETPAESNGGCRAEVLKPVQPWDLLSAIYTALGLNDALEPASSNTAAISVPPALAPLIPKYLDGRQKDLLALRSALEQGNFEVITRVGHNLKGTGAPYGFPEITAIGGSLERAGKDRNPDDVTRSIARLEVYLGDVNTPLASPARTAGPTVTPI